MKPNDVDVGDVIARKPPYHWPWLVVEKHSRGVVVELDQRGKRHPQDPHKHFVDFADFGRYHIVNKS